MNKIYTTRFEKPVANDEFLPLLPSQRNVYQKILEQEENLIKKRRAAHIIHEQRPTHISIKKPHYETMRNGREMEVV